jgi:hypothetical protein
MPFLSAQYTLVLMPNGRIYVIAPSQQRPLIPVGEPPISPPAPPNTPEPEERETAAPLTNGVHEDES